MNELVPAVNLAGSNQEKGGSVKDSDEELGRLSVLVDCFAKDYGYAISFNLEIAKKRREIWRYEYLNPKILRNLAVGLEDGTVELRSVFNTLSMLHVRMLELALGNSCEIGLDEEMRSIARRLVEQRFWRQSKLEGNYDYFAEENTQLLRLDMIEKITDLKIASRVFETNIIPVIKKAYGCEID